MAIVEILKVTNKVYDTVHGVHIDKTDDKADDNLDDNLDDKVTVLVRGGQMSSLIIYAFLNMDMARCETKKLSYTSFGEHCGRREASVTREIAKVALSPGSLYKSQYCTDGPPQWNIILVFPRWYFPTVEAVSFSPVDSRQTYVHFSLRYSTSH